PARKWATHRPGAGAPATDRTAVSGTQSRTSSAFGRTATPRSRNRAETAEPTRPEPMTLTDSNTKLQFRSGYRATQSYYLAASLRSSAAFTFGHSSSITLYHAESRRTSP